MSDTIVWTDGSKLRGKRLIDAYNRGVLVEHKTRASGAPYWLARCEHSGCQGTYNFSDTKSTRFIEARCSLHVSHKGALHNRLFWEDGTEIKGIRISNLFMEGRLVACRRRSATAKPVWYAKCKNFDCSNIYNASASQKDPAKMQLCRMHVNLALSRKGRGGHLSQNVFDKKYVWKDGTSLLSDRLRRAFDKGMLTRRQKYANGGAAWYARCEELGCQNEYNFSALHMRQCKEQKCSEHVSFHAIGNRRAKRKIAGHMTQNAFVIANADKVIWVKQGSRYRPYFPCKYAGCAGMKKYAASAKDHFRCVYHAGVESRREPYEAIYNSFVLILARRNKTRTEPIQNMFNLQSFADFCSRNQACFYCGVDLQRRAHYGKVRKGMHYSKAACLDRIDSLGAYSPENVVSCCGPCNASRGVFLSHEEMVIVAKIRQGKFREAVTFAVANAEKLKAWSRWVFDWRSSNRFSGRWHRFRQAIKRSDAPLDGNP